MPSVAVPVLYLFVVFGGLYAFTSWYKKRAASKQVEPYFASHPDRDVYVTLLGRTDPPTHDALLKSALVRRAMADVQRVLKVREDKPALQNLLQKGSVGDDLWNSLLAAEKELEAEILEVVAEANSFAEGWGQVIFQTANEMIANEKMRSVMEHMGEARLEKEAQLGLVRVQVKDGQALPPAGAAPALPPSTPSKPTNGTAPLSASPTPASPASPGKVR
ncbi:hypothetical protein FIBSPDRAFT_923569 [Athelia psychrophila]|uniref:Translocation protein sec66 n=1 Tax=Athelia psychrophila TaxID=1759441 RepID=A0A167TRP6_9AGAM|nr:hypothetical protein FIBSPDRAFT_923569 [Fibularhizoctonia sp. CBS 109695]